VSSGQTPGFASPRGEDQKDSEGFEWHQPLLPRPRLQHQWMFRLHPSDTRSAKILTVTVLASVLGGGCAAGLLVLRSMARSLGEAR